MALHIRRGDFEQHCQNLALWGSDWNGFNCHPDFPDQFTVPPGPNDSPERMQIYMKHCYPTIPQIVEKVMAVKNARRGKGTPLRKIFIMSNGSKEWLAELKAALMQEGPGEWDGIHSSRDLTLSWEQKYVAQAVDMHIGQRAQVFIGNGVSFQVLLLSLPQQC